MTNRKRATVIGVFENRIEAERAVDELEQAGFKHDDIGFAIRGEEVMRGGMITDADGAKDKKGALTGIASGGVVGGLLGAASALLLPGIGPVVAAGILAGFLGGAAAGSAIGGILGAMIGLGVSEEEAKYYEQQFRSGRALVAVRVGETCERCDEVVEIMRRHGGHDFESSPDSPIRTEGPLSEP